MDHTPIGKRKSVFPMLKDELFEEKIVRVEKPTSHFTFLCSPNGDFLGVSSENGLGVFDAADDRVGNPCELWSGSDGRPHRHWRPEDVEALEEASGTGK